jgi:hypothetical protein
MSKPFQIQLGDKVKDLVTGYEGIVIARTEYLNGCLRYGIQRTKLTKEGVPGAAEWIDEKQLVVVKAKAVKVEVQRTGGPAPTPRPAANPK